MSSLKMMRHFTLRILFKRYSLQKQMVRSLQWSRRTPIVLKLSRACFSSIDSKSNSGDNEDMLTVQLREADVSRLHELIEMHLSEMNESHLVHVLESLFAFKKDDILPNMFVETLLFKKLSKRLQQRARFFEADDVINVLKILSFLGMPSSSHLMQVYFQMLRHQINELTLKQLIFLEYLLKKQEPTPLVEALKVALPMVVENHLDIELDRDNLYELVMCFQIGMENNMAPSSLHCLAEAIIQYPKDIPLTLANRIFWSCFKLKKKLEPELFTNLVDKVMKVFILSTETLSPEQLVSLLSNFSKGYIFSSTVVKDTCRRAVDERWPFPLLYTLLVKTTSFEMYSQKLLDYYCESIVANGTEVRENSKYSIFRLVKPFAKANYIPEKSSEMLQIITSCENKVSKLFENYPELYLTFCIYLATLDCYHPKILGRICNEEFIDRLSTVLEQKTSTEMKNHRLKSMLVLSESINVHGYNMHFPEHMKIAAMKGMQQEKSEFSLQVALRNALGGKQYVLDGLFTRSGLFIDHFIAFNKEDRPIALINDHLSEESTPSQEFQFVEDINFPIDAYCIAVIAHPPLIEKSKNDISIISSQSGVISNLLVKLLNQNDFNVVEISLSSWKCMHDHEKIPYLKRRISCLKKQKYESNKTNKQNFFQF